MTTQQLARVESMPLAVASPEEAAQSFIRTAMNNGTSVGDMEKLLTIWKDLVSDGKKTAFDRAMTAFKASCPAMPRGHKAQFSRINKAGVEVAGRYSDLSDIAKTIEPVLKANGLAFEWEETELLEIGSERFYRAHVRIRHEGGHSERKSGPPIPMGQPVKRRDGTDVQSAPVHASAVITTAQRQALKSAFGLYSIDQDEEDAANMAAATETITEAQADELIGLLGDYCRIKGDAATVKLQIAMLKSIDAESINSIPAAKFDGVHMKLLTHVNTAKAGAK